MKRDRALESVKAFLPDDGQIETIIQVCDLYPIEDSWRKWTDHLGSYIQIQNNRNVTSYVHSPKDKSERIATDLHFKSPPETISSISKWAFISFAQTADIPNVAFVWFLGNDNRLRLLSYIDGVWTRNHPPLISGIETLRSVVGRFNYTGRANILYLKSPMPSKVLQSWSMDWPGYLDELIDFSPELGEAINGIKRNRPIQED